MDALLSHWDQFGVDSDLTIIYIAQDASFNTLAHGELELRGQIVAEFDVYHPGTISDPQALVSQMGSLAQVYPQLRSLYLNPTKHLKRAIFEGDGQILITQPTPSTAAYTLIEWLKAAPLTQDSAKAIVAYGLQVSQLYDQIKLLDPYNHLRCLSKLRVMTTDQVDVECYGRPVPTFGIGPFVSSTHAIELGLQTGEPEHISVLKYILTLACSETLGRTYLKGLLQELEVSGTIGIDRLLQSLE